MKKSGLMKGLLSTAVNNLERPEMLIVGKVWSPVTPTILQRP